MLSKKEKQEQKEWAMTKASIIDIDDDIYTIVHTVTNSNRRTISFWIIKNNTPIKIDLWIARILDMKIHKNGGIITTNDPFGIVYELAYQLFGSGYALNQRCL